MAKGLSQAEALREVTNRIRYNALHFYRPYPKQFEFHKAGASYRERLLMKGNQLGGTLAGASEFAMHVTGEYPDWWPGWRFDRPIVAWVGSETNEKSKEIIQQALFGVERPDWNDPDFGTGALPRATIADWTFRQAGVKDVVDTIRVKHIKGGTSQITLKNYQQGVEVWTGKKVDLVWPDEEMKHDRRIYAEAVTRTNAADGGRIYMTFTPHNGMTEIVESFLTPKPGDSPKSVTVMSINECIGGIWPAGTPWSGQTWKGHYTREQADAIIAAYPSHERECRAFGVPQAGEGRVFTVAESLFKVPGFEIPDYYRRVIGIDFGIDHPFALASLAHDADDDVVYVTSVWRLSGGTPLIHAEAIKSRGDWIPVAWPHDGGARESDGVELHKKYRAHGVTMLSDSARYDDDKGGPQKVEPIVVEMQERLETGRLKVFENCHEFFEEYRFLHRKDGRIVAEKDDVLKAVMYGLMMIRKARTKPRGNVVALRPAVRRGARNW